MSTNSAALRRALTVLIGLAVASVTALSGLSPVLAYDTPTSSLSGSVLGEGTGLLGITVALSGSAVDSVPTGTDGGFSFSGLPSGTYSLSVTDPSGDWASVTLPVVLAEGSNALEPITLSRAVAPQGVTGVVTGGGTPLSGIGVTATGPSTLSTKTGTDGRFSLALSAGVYTVQFTDPAGSFGTWQSTSLTTTVSASLVDLGEVVLTAYPTYSLAGTVTDGGGAAVEGLTVKITESGSVHTDVTDELGHYAIGALRSTSVQVEAGGPGTLWNQYWGLSVTLPVSSYNFTVTLVPTGPGSISGIVTDRSTGDPIPNASVSAFSGGFGKSVSTDSNGNYSLANLPLGNYFLSVSTSGGSPGWQSQSAQLVLTESNHVRERNFALKLVPTGDGVVYGVVVDGDGHPIAHLSVSISQVGVFPGPSVPVQTNDSGEFRKEGLVKGRYQLSVFSSSYQPIPYRDSLVSVASSSSVVNFGTLTLRTYVVGDGSVRGKVVEAGTTTPIEGAPVTLFPRNPQARSAYAVTNADGIWTLDSLAYGTYSVSIGPPRGPRGYEYNLDTPPLEVSGSTRIDREDSLRAVVPGTGGITGVVRDAVSHLAIAGASITLMRSAGGYTVAPAVSDSTGKFTVTSLPAGNYDGWIRRDGYEQARLQVTVEDKVETVRVSLTATAIGPVAAAGAGKVDGVVTDPFGQPVSGAFVFVLSASGGIANNLAQTDSDGYFAFEELPLGSLDLSVSAMAEEGSYVPNRQTVTLNAGHTQETLSIRLVSGASLEGFVSVPPDVLHDGITAYAVDPTTGEQVTFGDSVNATTGYYSIDGLAEGRYLIYFAQPAGSRADVLGPGISPAYWADGAANGSATRAGATSVSVRAGETSSGHDLTLLSGGALAGSVAVGAPGGVVNLGSAKVIKVSIFASSGGLWEELPLAQVFASRFNDGRYSITGLAPGEYRLKFEDSWTGNRALTTQYSGGADSLEAAQTITVVAGETADSGRPFCACRNPLPRPKNST